MEHTAFDHPRVFAVKHKNESERLASQSGGAFAVLSDLVLEQGGVIYGCAFDEEFQAVHIRADNAEDRDRMRYSKYVQSNMGDTYNNVRKDLEEGKTVLFSGTSCQVAGLREYIKICGKASTGSLYCVDIVCHGVPSPRVWRDYLAWESRKKKAQIKGVICRNKTKYGWKSHIVTVKYTNGKESDRKVYPKIFYSHVALRPACYKCPYKSIHHPSDITIADYWGIEKALPGFKDDKGVSLVMINSPEGQALFDACSDKIIYKGTRIEDSMQKPLIEPYDSPNNRTEFWKDYDRLTFTEIAKKYGDYSIYNEIKWRAKYYMKSKVLKR